MTEILLRPAPHDLTALVDTRFEEALYSSAISFITSHFTAEATFSTYTLPPPSHLSLLITMLVHPSTTATPLRRQCAHLVSRVLDVASPRAAKLDKVWSFSRKRKRKTDTSDDEEDLTELETESLFVSADGVWEVIEWAFYKGNGGWVDILNHLVRVLRYDLDECILRSESEGTEAIDDSILVIWLRDSGRKAAFPKAIRSILATSGGELMMDKPRGIYDSTSSSPSPPASGGDIWDGSILLSHRTGLLTMIYELSRSYPVFLQEAHYLDTLSRKLSPLDYRSLASFLANITSLSFRIALCEMFAQQISPESARSIIHLQSDCFSLQCLMVYIRSLPQSGREAASDLAKYSIIVGILLRSWVSHTRGKEGGRELVSCVEEAMKRREPRIAALKQGDREEIGNLVRREGRMMKLMAMKLQRGE